MSGIPDHYFYGLMRDHIERSKAQLRVLNRQLVPLEQKRERLVKFIKALERAVELEGK